MKGLDISEVLVVLIVIGLVAAIGVGLYQIATNQYQPRPIPGATQNC